MEEMDAAVIMNFAPLPLKGMWHDVALTRAERTFSVNNPDRWQTILDDKEDYAFAVELVYSGTEVGQYGNMTNFEIRPKIDENVAGAEGVEINRELAKEFAELWGEQVIEVLDDVEDKITLSAREFATLTTMHDSTCEERRAADALGISVGTYRGKKGRIKEKFKTCSESSVLRQLLRDNEEIGISGRRTLGDHADRVEGVAPTDIYSTRLEADDLSPWKYPREDPTDRDHETYEEPHWRTAHIEGIDQVFTTESPDGVTDESIRVDLDGVGHAGADMHRAGENLQVSFWMQEFTAGRLYKQLSEAIDNPELLDRMSNHALGRLEILDIALEVGDRFDVVGPMPFAPKDSSVEISAFRPGVGDEESGIILKHDRGSDIEYGFAGAYAVAMDFAEAVRDGRLTPAEDDVGGSK